MRRNGLAASLAWNPVLGSWCWAIDAIGNTDPLRFHRKRGCSRFRRVALWRLRSAVRYQMTVHSYEVQTFSTADQTWVLMDPDGTPMAVESFSGRVIA